MIKVLIHADQTVTVVGNPRGKDAIQEHFDEAPTSRGTRGMFLLTIEQELPPAPITHDWRNGGWRLG